MKKSISAIMLIAALIIVFSACTKATHSIRIKNNYTQAMTDMKVNETSYGAIAIGATTDYKPVDEGEFTISGTTSSGFPLSGSGKVTGNGKHKWTMTIGADGKLALSED
jgi:hypothetical protein